MNMLRSFALGSLLLLAPTLHAEKRAHKKADAKLAVVDDEPMSQAATQKPAVDEIKVQALTTRGTEDPQLRTMTSPAPPPAAVGVQTGLPDAVTHQPAPPPDAATPPPASLTDDAIVELAAKQMRRERKALDACAAEAQARNPTATGTVTLHFTVADRKVVNVVVDKDSLHDPELAACLVKAGHALKLTLKQATFYCRSRSRPQPRAEFKIQKL